MKTLTTPIERADWERDLCCDEPDDNAWDSFCGSDLERLLSDVNSLEKRIEKIEQFMMFLGDLCDSPDSLRHHLADACEEIEISRKLEGKKYPKWSGRWKPFTADQRGDR